MKISNNLSSLTRLSFTVCALGRTSFIEIAVYAVCKVFCFILSDDDFEIKSKTCSLDSLSCLIHILNYKMSSCILRDLSLFYTCEMVGWPWLLAKTNFNYLW